MTAATAAFLTRVMRLSSGVYSSVAAAEAAMMMRSASGSCRIRNDNKACEGTCFYIGDGRSVWVHLESAWGSLQTLLTRTHAEMSTQLYRKKLSSRAPSSGTEPRGRGWTGAHSHQLCHTCIDEQTSLGCPPVGTAAHLGGVVDDIDSIVKEVIQHAGANGYAAGDGCNQQDLRLQQHAQ